MTAICVEDESLILQLTVSLCQELPALDEVQGFQKAQDALQWLETHTAQIALLDIDMPDMDGLALAEKIQRAHPETAIIFLTGYAQYAVEAFQLHVSGYLLKPMTKASVADALANLRYRPRESAAKPVEVRCFGAFEVLVDGRPVQFGRTKSKELFAYLVDRRGSSCTYDMVVGALWPDRRVGETQKSMVRTLLSDTPSARARRWSTRYTATLPTCPHPSTASQCSP